MPWLDYAAIRARVSLQDVLRLLHWAPTYCRGDQARGRCPLCQSTANDRATNRVFSVHLTRHLYHCFHCHRAGNQIGLWSHHKQLSHHDAAIDLCQQLGIPLSEVEISQPRNRRNPAS